MASPRALGSRSEYEPVPSVRSRRLGSCLYALLPRSRRTLARSHSTTCSEEPVESYGELGHVPAWKQTSVREDGATRSRRTSSLTHARPSCSEEPSRPRPEYPAEPEGPTGESRSPVVADSRLPRHTSVRAPKSPRGARRAASGASGPCSPSTSTSDPEGPWSRSTTFTGVPTSSAALRGAIVALRRSPRRVPRPVRNRSAPRSRARLRRPEGLPRPALEPDRPEAPHQSARSAASPRRALRRENRRASRDTWKGRFEPPSPGFPPLRRLLNEDSHLRRACLTRLRCAFRFSQPLDAFLRPRPFGLVSCRFRPWGSCSQRFPPPSSRHDFRRALSPGRGRRSRVDSPSLGIPAPGRSVHIGAVLPASDGRASLSVLPLRGSHPRALTPGYTGVSSHGLPHGADRSTP